MSDVNNLLDDMQKRFNPTATNGLDAIFQYDIADNGSWQIKIQNSSCTITEGAPSEASVTLSMDLETLTGVMNGEIDGMQAFMSGDIQASGDIMLATRLTDIFPLNGG